MAHKVVVESKHILSKVLLGVVTGVLATVILYFLLNKDKKISTAEIKKGTINAWKAYVAAENKTEELFDSSFKKVQRSLTEDKAKNDQAFREFWRRDSLTTVHFIDQLKLLKERKDIDKDFSILLGARMTYQQQQTSAGRKYFKSYKAIMDSTLNATEKNELAVNLNTANNMRLSNITLRIGRNIEYFADLLTKRYKYPFDFSDISYYSAYMGLKREKILKPKAGVAPADPKEMEN